MTTLQVEAAKKNAIQGSKSFISCHWDEADKCLVYQFNSGTGAEEFKFYREMQSCTLRMAATVHHANLSSLREYHPN